MFYIGFSTGKRSPISALIRWATKSKVSHTFLIFDDLLLGDRYILQADRGGFQVTRLMPFLLENVLVREVQVDLPIEAIRAADRWVGRVGYDYEGLFGEAIVKIANWFKWKIKNPLHAPKSLFCSEAMATLLKIGGYPGSDLLVPDGTSPQDLLEFLEAHPSAVASRGDGVAAK